MGLLRLLAKHPITCGQQRSRLQGEVTIGTGRGCALKVSGSNIASEHAKIFPKGGRIFCRALVGDADDPRAETGTWILPATQLRAGVDYMLSPGVQARLCSACCATWLCSARALVVKCRRARRYHFGAAILHIKVAPVCDDTSACHATIASCAIT
jgi:hypothetical protein